MKLDQIAVYADKGMTAHYFRMHSCCALYLSDAGRPMHSAQVVIHAPPEMAERIERLAAAINAVMADTTETAVAELVQAAS